MKEKTEIEKKIWSKKKKVIIFSCIGVIVVALLGIFVYAYGIFENPMSQFKVAAQQIVQTPDVTNSSNKDAPKATSAAPTPSNKLDDIVNIMLIGVDYSPDVHYKKAFHADVMIVLSINTKSNEMHLISLPRDTYAKIPGIKGIYKLNASIDCGGGWPNASGFEKVCEAATWMLGGIPVKYYYAVDFEAVKGLVDRIGGVDYNVDVSFTGQEGNYSEGKQHMDGAEVLDYLRVRKNLGSESGDLNRINRQKKMLVAIFEKLKQSGMLAMIPTILSEFEGKVYTNTTLSQTAGLAAFAYKIDADSIKMHSMDGKLINIFNWNFVITDQEKRVQMIKEIYGVDVPAYEEYAYEAAKALWEKMQQGVSGRVNYERDYNEVYVDFR